MMSKPPVVIAHRGASGYLPEHSLEAKVLAFGFGADFLEQDLVASRDGHLLVLHDLWLENVSDVAAQFGGRERPDKHFYCIDFDLDEIRSLKFHERRNPATGTLQYPNRFSDPDVTFSVVTFEEELQLVADLNSSSEHQIGIYPEIKHPAWHQDQGVDITRLALDALDRHGYLNRPSEIFLQCVDQATLRQVRATTGPQLPIIQLLGSRTESAVGLLDGIAGYAEGIGPSIKLILQGYDDAGQPVLTDLVRQARARDLLVHPYTFRIDDLPTGCSSFEKLLELFIDQLEVNGLFTDFADNVIHYLREGPEIDN